MKPMQFLISDAHIGTSLWQHAMLRHLGVAVHTVSLSRHTHYAPADMLHDARWVRHLGWLPRGWIERQMRRDPILSQTTEALCSFPPKRCLDLLRLPAQVRVWVNLGHRLHIHLPGHRLRSWTEQVAQLMTSPRMVWSSMSRYDTEYAHYYTGLRPAHELEVACMHLPAELRLQPHRPTLRTVLVGPSHHRGSVPGLPSLDELNRMSREWARQLGVAAYDFQTIRQAYPAGDATPANLARHPAVVLSPYSAFSISMVELYQMNLPMFAPVDGLLVDAMNDVRLAPIYQYGARVHQLDATFAEQARARGLAHSPNSSDPQARKYWLQHMFFNRVPCIQRFDGAVNLIHRLYEADLSDLSERMRQYNTDFIDRQCDMWRRLVVPAAAS